MKGEIFHKQTQQQQQQNHIDDILYCCDKNHQNTHTKQTSDSIHTYTYSSALTHISHINVHA